MTRSKGELGQVYDYNIYVYCDVALNALQNLWKSLKGNR